MTDAPKRRPGRPRKWVDDPWSAVVPSQATLAAARDDVIASFLGTREPTPTARIRIRAGVVQQAWQHPTGIEWRPLPVVPDTAPDWEDG